MSKGEKISKPIYKKNRKDTIWGLYIPSISKGPGCFSKLLLNLFWGLLIGSSKTETSVMWYRVFVTQSICFSQRTECLWICGLRESNPIGLHKKVHLVLHGKYSSSFIVKCGEDFNSLAYYNVECLSRLHLTQNVEYLGELIGQFLAAFLHSYFPSQVNFWEGSGKVFHYCVFLGQCASRLTLLSVYSLYISLPEREWS